MSLRQAKGTSLGHDPGLFPLAEKAWEVAPRKGPSRLIVTGPSGAGKSLACAILAERGYKILQGDLIAHALYAPGKPAWKKLHREFGSRYFDPKGSLDRREFGALFFSSLAARKRANAILYPPFIKEVRKRLAASRGKVCVDMAVYFDAGAPRLGAQVLLVDAPLASRLVRLRRRGVAPERALLQAKALKFGPKERAAAALILVNQSTPTHFRAQLEAGLRKLAGIDNFGPIR